MNRTGRGDEARLRALLLHTHARRLEKGLDFLRHRTEALAKCDQISHEIARERIYLDMLRRCGGRFQPEWASQPPVFFCDAGLGGLARWLRAAGYQAEWEDAIDDVELLRVAAQRGNLVITTDSMLMERRVIREAQVESYWLAPKLRPAEQLEWVMREFRLRLLAPRCMQCGGSLQSVDRESMKEVIPPKTYLWKNEYFVCSRCGKLLWHGTHWERIQKALLAAEHRAMMFWKKELPSSQFSAH